MACPANAWVALLAAIGVRAVAIDGYSVLQKVIVGR